MDEFTKSVIGSINEEYQNLLMMRPQSVKLYGWKSLITILISPD